MIGLCTNRNARLVPMAIDKASGINVTRSVIMSECSSAGALLTKVLAIRLGDGTRYDGTAKAQHVASHPARIKMPTTSGGNISAIFFPLAANIMPSDPEF